MSQVTPQDEYFMQRALAQAERGAALGEVPVGAVIVDQSGQIIAEGCNQPISGHDATAHAEIVALRMACEARQNYRLPGTTLYVTLEPCAMCAGAIIHARVARVVYGAEDPKAGAAGSVFTILGTDRLNHVVLVRGGVMAERCGTVLVDFFRARR